MRCTSRPLLQRISARDELHQGLRSAQHGRYLIFFLEVSDKVRIVRFLHGVRDLPQAFEP